MVNLPGLIDTEKVSAQNTNGVLTVTLPKAEAGWSTLLRDAGVSGQRPVLWIRIDPWL